ncbi:MAG: methyltransferase domain-containing protein [Ignavibacteria bacterium]|nr:methyltransferase domain-containing protein [Ignavibacteria bacterium]
MGNLSDYLLGVNQRELERLQFQHSVWGPVTRRFFERLGAGKGWKCLDVGAGPGFVSNDLRQLVGQEGEVTALEPSELYLNWFKDSVSKKGWTNVKFVRGTAEQAPLPSRYFDLVFARWVIAFVPDPDLFLSRLVASMRVGGIIAFQDYYYEGLSLFPCGGAWDRMPDVVRAYYRSGEGDAFITGRLPAMFANHGLKLIDFTPTCLAGGPGSPVMEWAHQFFSIHTQHMVEKGIITQDEADALQSDWEAHRRNPNALFFSPLVVDVGGLLQL